MQSKALSNNSSNTNYKRLRKFNNILLTKSNNEKNTKYINKVNDLIKVKIDNSKNNSSITKEKDYLSYVYEDNIKFQAKIFEEQVRLLNNCFREYKNYYNDNNFLEVFKT